MRAHQRPRPIESLVQSLVVCTRYVPPNARRLLAASELSLALERVAMDVQRGRQAWFAWTDERRIWFVVAEMATRRHRHCQHESVRMFFYDDDARFLISAAWILRADGRWILVEL